MNCREALPWIHEYLDGTLEGPQSLELKKHLLSCPACRDLLKSMERTEGLIRTMPKPVVPDGLTSRIMGGLPQKKKKTEWLKWIQRHPAISVASVFLLVMLGSFLSLWNQDTDLVVKGSDLDQVVITGNTVIVPAGKTVNGDLMVKGGTIKVDGDLKGNLTVIDGSINLASTAHISGQIKEVDRALDWLWFQVNEIYSLATR
ncbi:hypothetical protein J31TS4_46840 [Paenibacillus sp. J31TS4]|uniref:zf-HC2 domain-containing protein n=1 Tax=Paenibacillus sp. J31TS4 TaxID=2807195 RepID=UPI001B1B1937|nr:zf-HC2 domain-containing protein [Paenibacillus sp. J31TS4]GIP41404.1 hypothetical protein J31TS4_46840 [Paenibacillus sp. J31TS4]